MSASVEILHRMFGEVVAQYHPFADYLGFDDCEQGFIVYYRGSGEIQYILIDTEGNIVGDTTVGTTRSMGLLALGAAVLGAFMGDQQNR